MDLSKKNDWTNVYIQPTPAEYLLFAKHNEYHVPDFACEHIRPLLDKQAKQLQRPLKILDLGASYGIMSSLLRSDLSLSQLTDFYVQDDHAKTLTDKQIAQFFAQNQQKQDQFRFYLTDISQPAMDYAKRQGLCEQAFCLDMGEGQSSDELRAIIPEIDLYMAVGSLAYIGNAFFAEILPMIKANRLSPMFAFTVYRTFYPHTLEQLFKQYGYRLQRVGDILKKARCFASKQEQEWAVEQLHQREIDTVGFEDEGYYACEFLLAAPKTLSLNLN